MGRGSFAELNEDLLGNQTLVAYAAKAGTTAADGGGRNSPYTSALLVHLEQPLEIGMLFRRVRTSPRPFRRSSPTAGRGQAPAVRKPPRPRGRSRRSLGLALPLGSDNGDLS